MKWFDIYKPISSFSDGMGLVSDQNDNVYVAGDFRSQTVFGYDTLTGMSTNPNQISGYFLKYGPGSFGLIPAGDTICSGNQIQLQASGGTRYIWTPNTQISSTSIANPIIIPLVSRKYHVKIINDTLRCVRQYSTQIQVELCTSVNGEIHEQLVKVYPNPVSESLTVQAPLNSKLSLYNASGCCILTFLTEVDVLEIDLRQLVPGIYFLKAQTLDRTVTNKIIKE